MDTEQQALDMNGPTESLKKIAMIVYNSVSHDARVIKEAETLQDAGFAVRIHGIQDARQSTPFETLDSGVEIVRVGWKHRVYQEFTLLAGVGAMLGAVLVYFAAMSLFRFAIALFYFAIEIGAVQALSFLLASCVFVVGLMLTWRLHRRTARLRELSTPTPTSAGSNRGAGINGLFKQVRYLLKRLFATRAMEAGVQEALAQFNPDAVHCHDLPTLPAGVRYCSRRAAQCVYDSHEIYEEQGAFGGVIKRMFSITQRRYSGGVDAFITINDSIAKFLNERYPKFPEAVIVRNATRYLAKPVEYDGRLHAAADLDRDIRILLYQGGFAARRGLELLVRSAPFLPDGWCLVMMGWGALEDKLKSVAKQVDPQGNQIRFVPSAPQAELVHWTAGATVGVIPYENVNLNHWYCTPNKLWEYPNAGVPPLVSPFPELRKAVEGAQMGWLLDENLDPHRIAAKIASLSDDDLSQARANCRKFVENDNWTKNAERLVGLYRNLLVA